MRLFSSAICAVSLVFALAACSGGDEAATEQTSEAGTFAGTWVGQTDTLQDDEVRSYLIADGTYTCNHCIPAYSVAASGDFEAVERPGADGVKVAVVDDNTVEFAIRLGDKTLSESTWTVSEDGQTMTVAATDMSGDEPVTSTTTYTRAAAGPDGSHAVSGEWKFAGLGDMDEAARTFTYAIDGDQMTETGVDGSMTMTIGGEAVVPEWSTTGAATAVEKISDTAYRFTTTLDGEVVGTTEMSVEGDTLTGKYTDPRNGSTSTWTAKRKTS
ncbi:MAG: hypothetical protein V2I74_12480 [Erythrobacter sp.]|jgi:hypothetical protein|nr:hypothetical protein [Erythrobacter sp.]